MNPSRQDLAAAFARLIPNMIRGAQIGFLAKHRITQTQFIVLMSVHAYQRCAMGDVAKNLHVQMPTVTGIVDRLVAAGHLTRVVQPEDRRKVLVQLTAKGREFVRGFQVMLKDRWSEVLSVLSPKEIQFMYRSIEKIQQQFRTEAGR